MSSASPWSATCLRMKLRKPAYSRSTASEIRWSSCAIGHCLLSASSIYICRRLGKGKYCKENALVANLVVSRARKARENLLQCHVLGAKKETSASRVRSAGLLLAAHFVVT